MPIINMAQSEAEANAKGTNVYRVDANHDGSVIIWTYETHHGLCLSDREANGSWDSDWYMLVWNEEKQATEEICFASTRGWSYPCYGSSPDATPEVAQKANDYRRRIAVAAAIGSDKRKARTPQSGRLVKVVKGRKAPLGDYIVHHTMEDGYRKASPYALAWGFAEKPQRLALQPLREDGTVNRAVALIWTADTNVVVLNPEQYETPEAEIINRFANEKWYFPVERRKVA